MQKVIPSLSVVKGVKMSQLQIKDYSSFIQLEDKYTPSKFYFNRNEEILVKESGSISKDQLP